MSEEEKPCHVERADGTIFILCCAICKAPPGRKQFFPKLVVDNRDTYVCVSCYKEATGEDPEAD